MLCHPDITKGSVIVIQATHTPMEPDVTFSLVNEQKGIQYKRTKNFFFVQFTF